MSRYKICIMIEEAGYWGFWVAIHELYRDRRLEWLRKLYSKIMNCIAIRTEVG